MRPVANHDRIGIATGSGNHGEGAAGSWRPGVDRRAGLAAGNSVLLGAGCRIVPVPVDDEGINVSAGVNLLPKARAAFVTPSHQYPLGVTMSASRRLRLLDWARDNGAWVVEDDYDGAYRYDTTAVSSLQGIDSEARVIYIGTFSRVIFPSVRVSYIVIPPDLIERFMAVRFSLGICRPTYSRKCSQISSVPVDLPGIFAACGHSIRNGGLLWWRACRTLAGICWRSTAREPECT